MQFWRPCASALKRLPNHLETSSPITSASSVRCGSARHMEHLHIRRFLGTLSGPFGGEGLLQQIEVWTHSVVNV